VERLAAHRPLGCGGLAADSKKAREGRAHIVLIDETGLFLNPLVRRSWAVRGHTPVIGGDGGHRKKVSVIGAVSVSPRVRRVFLNPLVRRSWAVRGHTPVIGGDGGHRKKVSVIGAVSVSPRVRRVGLYSSTRWTRPSRSVVARTGSTLKSPPTR
jgi:hypothetical protein